MSRQFYLNSRRRFLSHIAAAGLVAAARPAIAAPETLTIVDCHQHLWDLERQKLPWLQGPGESPLKRSFVMKDYIEATRGTGVDRAVYMEVDVAADEKDKEAEILTAICLRGDSPTIGAVVGGVPDDPHFADYIGRWKGNKFIKGVRIVLHGGDDRKAGRSLTPEFLRGMKVLADAKMSFDICMPATNLGEGAKLAAKCPETRIVVDHCGNANAKAWMKEERRGGEQTHAIDAWKRDLEALAACKNTICKISGIIATVPKEWSAADLAPAINFCLDTYGPDRVVVGSDWPVCLKGGTLAAWIQALREIVAERPAAEQRKLFSENAMKFYSLG